MLQIQDIKKEYKTGQLMQTALNGININFRSNEFVAILGPSGSGKTTLLNIIGGLDRYDSGDLIINGTSTKKYTDADWDSYRNHTIGFVFQNYNLIPHQSILSNVELALTISGISKQERRKRAKECLKKVGLAEQIHKKPNQMSGGQMQRVAIARALVNDPDILLADEPTGALDSETSLQVMDLLKEVAKDRLVIMVTHNPELANKYATRTVSISDGKIISDTNPYTVNDSEFYQTEHKNMGRSSMSFFTSLTLSFNNLLTKKGRTILTAFAGSIGIIGIALIIAISSGVNTYISDIQKSTMASYPISIQQQSVDLSSIISESSKISNDEDSDIEHELDGIYSNMNELEIASKVTTSITENNLTSFKEYLDNPESKIHQYIGENGVVYSYDTKFNVYTYDSDKKLINTDGSTLDEKSSDDSLSNQMMLHMDMRDEMLGNTNNFTQLMPGTDGELISKTITENYELLYGTWPSKYNEVVLVLDKNNEISATTLYKLGLLPYAEYKELAKQIDEGKEINLDIKKLNYEQILNQEFYLIPACDMYKKNSDGRFESIKDNTSEIENLFNSSTKLKISGVVRFTKSSDNALIKQPLAYTSGLTDYLIAYTNESEIVKKQEENPEINVTNGMKFSPSDNKEKISDAKKYLKNLEISEKAKLCKEIFQSIYQEDEQSSKRTMSMDETTLAKYLDEYLKNPDDDVVLSIYDNYISTGTYDENMNNFGVVSINAPSGIDIYTDSFENKDYVSECIDDYNSNVSEEEQITYVDYVGLIMSSVTTIINIISYVLIAFVSVSLIVSSIMIGIITYISVLERTKEIGILRSIGASKSNISRLFNAETFIIGLFSGTLGIIVSILLTIPINAIIHTLVGTDTVNAVLPVASAISLILLSIILTLIGGLIPAKKAAKSDPVTALRSE